MKDLKHYDPSLRPVAKTHGSACVPPWSKGEAERSDALNVFSALIGSDWSTIDL
jgi:hypothetical protein